MGEDSPKLRRKARYSAEGNCHYCSVRTFPSGSAESIANPRRLRTNDHVVPESRGGEEVVIACNDCNNARGDAPYELFLHWSRYVAFGDDANKKRKAFSVWMYSLAIAAFRVKRRHHEEFREPWVPAAIVYEKPKARGRYSRKELRAS